MLYRDGALLLVGVMGKIVIEPIPIGDAIEESQTPTPQSTIGATLIIKKRIRLHFGALSS